jgi:hypothetical protein
MESDPGIPLDLFNVICFGFGKRSIAGQGRYQIERQPLGSNKERLIINVDFLRAQ